MVKELSHDGVLLKHRANIQKGIEALPTLQYGIPQAMGNYRWTDGLILATWYQGTYGVPPKHLEYKVGRSGGGFDALDFRWLPEDKWLPEEERVDLSITLNKRGDGLAERRIPIPVYGAGMSYGSVSLNVMLARAMAARELGTYTCTGEGGYPKELKPYSEHIIVQASTGYFGVNEETLQIAPIVELKYAQGAKPGLGGHLLADKNTTEVSTMREVVPWVSLFQPFPFHSVYSVEDHRKHVDWIKQINPEALVSVKVSTPTDIDMVAIGIYYAGAHIIHIDGGYGGTGASPLIAKKNIALPIEYAIWKVHRYLLQEGVRDKVTIMASGGIRTAYDCAKAIALGADGCVIGTSELIGGFGCTQCGNCERGRGCQIGITTTDPALSRLIDPKWGARRIVNLYRSWSMQWKGILRRLGLRSIAELRGRKDLLVYRRGA